MPFKSGKEQIFPGPCVVKADAAGGTPVTVGEIREEGAKVKITAMKNRTQLQTSSKTVITGYQAEISFDLANLSVDNITQLETLLNIDADVIIEQSVKEFTNPRTMTISNCRIFPDIDTLVGINDAAKIGVQIEKGAQLISDIVTVVDAANS